MIANKAKTEYKEFIQKYIFPLLGIPNNNNIESCSEDDQKLYCNQLVFQGLRTNENKRYIYFCNNTHVLLKTFYLKDFDKNDIDLAFNIVQFFFKVSNYNMNSKNTNLAHKYYSSTQKETNYKMALQKGICNWIIKNNNKSIEEFFEKLEKWSVQTYEGKNVTLGFVINPDAHSNFDCTYGSWSNFLDDDISAVFTDCIHSVIELDGNCNFIQYLSISKNDTVNQYELNHSSAYRFSAIMQKYVKGNCVGVFLLNNGDIILSKDGAIKLVKRNLKWLNFSYDAFKNSFGDYLYTHQIPEPLLQNIFASMLDVSFSHCGGIIAVVNDLQGLLKTVPNDLPILNSCDYLSDKNYKEIEAELKAMPKKLSEIEIQKRMLKRTVIQSLVDNKSFSAMDRKLRCELISLDGACIIDNSGKVCACGAIIKNDSGSTGGGRGAACKKLSHYGFAIKISTDGYIELYVDERNIYSIK